MGRSHRKRRVKGAGFFGIPKKPKQSPVSRILVEDLPHLNRAEKKLRGLEQLAQTNPLVFEARFKDSRKRFVKLLEQTIITVAASHNKMNLMPGAIYKDYPSLQRLGTGLREKLEDYKRQIAQEKLEETKKIIASTKKTRRKRT